MKITFGIRTNLQRPHKLAMGIHSILSQGIPADRFEILITGKTDSPLLAGEFAQTIRLLPDSEAAEKGLLGRMYNTLAATAKFENICLLDDDILLLDGWYAKLVEHLGNQQFDVVSFPIKNTDGSRFWDWVAWRPGWEAPALLRYNQTSTDQYVTGGMVLIKRGVWEIVKWSNSLGFYQSEDADWSHRAWAAGFRLSFCRAAFVLHNDWRYYRMGIGVSKYSDIGSAILDLPTYRADSEDQHAIMAHRDRLLIEVDAYRCSTSYRIGKAVLAPARWMRWLLNYSKKS